MLPLCQSTSNGSTTGIHEHSTQCNQAAGGQHARSGMVESPHAYCNTHHVSTKLFCIVESFMPMVAATSNVQSTQATGIIIY